MRGRWRWMLSSTPSAAGELRQVPRRACSAKARWAWSTRRSTPTSTATSRSGDPQRAAGARGRDLDGESRFRNEAQAAGRLSHPNIVSVYEYAQTGPQRYIAMEYVAGVSLHETVVHGFRLPLADTLSVIVQLLDALECAHAQGVWHRDIKPANLLLTAEGRLKVTDFGIARIDDGNLTHHTTVLGSPGYMAPERYTDEAPDARVDIFSCGVLLYELLAGSAPFRGSAGAVMYQVLHRRTAAALDAAAGAGGAGRLRRRGGARDGQAPGRSIRRRGADARCAARRRRRAGGAAGVGRDDAPAAPRPRSDAPTQVMLRPPAVMLHGSTLPTGWDAKDAAGDRAAAAAAVFGPMTRHVVRDATRRSGDLATLIATLARETLDPPEGVRSRREPSTCCAPPPRALTCTRSTPATDRLAGAGHDADAAGAGGAGGACAGRADRPDRRAAGAPRGAEAATREVFAALAQALTRDGERPRCSSACGPCPDGASFSAAARGAPLAVRSASTFSAKSPV